MISERAKTLLSEAGVRDGEPAIIFLEEGEEVFAFRMFRASDHTGDPEQQAIRWLGQAKGICRSDHGELRTGMFRSKDEKNVLAAVSGREIEAREWPSRNPDHMDKQCRIPAGYTDAGPGA